MIITVGTGEVVSHGICFSIKQQNPEYVIFIVTKESKEKTLPFILQDREMQDRKFEEVVLTNENDVEEIRFECQKIVEKIMKKHYEAKNIVIDYTSGTKSMSVGLVIAALDKRIGSLVYVGGKRDKNGRVISGLERPIALEPNRIYVEELFDEAVKLFNTCQYDSCLEIANQAKSMVANHIIENKITLLEKLAQAYSLWDKFNLGESFSLLNTLSSNSLLADWGIKSRLEGSKEILYKERNMPFCEEKVADLLENARRRGDAEKKYDDAVARLYRLLEYIAQFEIDKHGLYRKNGKGDPDTEDLNIDKLPAELKNKYSKHKDSKDNKVKLSLHQDYELLFDVNSNLGKTFKQEYETGGLRKVISSRNNSILAHGFNPVSEENYRKILVKVEKLIRIVVPDIDYLLDKVKFPQIKI